MTFPRAAAAAGGASRLPAEAAERWAASPRRAGVGAARRPRAALLVSARAAAATGAKRDLDRRRFLGARRGFLLAQPRWGGRRPDPVGLPGTDGGSALRQPWRGAAAGPGRGLRSAEPLFGCAAPAPKERSWGAPGRAPAVCVTGAGLARPVGCGQFGMDAGKGWGRVRIRGCACTPRKGHKQGSRPLAAALGGLLAR